MATKYTEDRESYLQHLKTAEYELFCTPVKADLTFSCTEVGKNITVELKDNTNEIELSSHLFKLYLSYKVKYSFFGTPNNVPVEPKLKVIVDWNDIKYDKCILYKDNKMIKCDKRTIMKTVNFIKSSKKTKLEFDFKASDNYDDVIATVNRKLNEDAMKDKKRFKDVIDNICKRYKTLPNNIVVDENLNEKFVIFSNPINDIQRVKRLVSSYDTATWAIDSGSDRADAEESNNKIIKELSSMGTGIFYYHLVQPDVNTIKEVKF